MSKQRLRQFIGVGQVIKEGTRDGERVIKVRQQKMRLDTRLMMYFPHKKDRWCLDPVGAKPGDIIVMKNLQERYKKDVYAKVDSIMFAVGNIVDPVTGRKCRGTEYIDEAAREEESGQRNVEVMTKKTVVETEL